MVSLITASHNFFNSHNFLTHLNFPLTSALFLDINPERTRRRRPQVAYTQVLGFAELRRGSGFYSWSCWCKRWESDGDLAVEAEILEFMMKSDNPEAFPTKEELLDAGRIDLVDAILRIGGWLSLGWGLDDENEEDVTVNSDSGVVNIGEFKRRVESIQESNSFEEAEVACSGEPSVSMTSSPSASPSGISLDLTTAEEDAGIKGILSRLEKQRNLSFGINLGKNGYATHASTKDDGDPTHFGTSTGADRADLEKNSRLTSGSPSKSISNNSGSKLSHNGSLYEPVGLRNTVQPEMWRTWSLQRAGSSNTEFEAAEISFNENQMERRKEDSKDEILGIPEVTAEALDRQTGINHNQIRTHLQHLEHELSSALLLLRSKSEEFVLKGNESTSSDLQKLSDAREFQENEFMNAQDKLRSIRAKLAVLEGKMALAIIDAQKIAEEKQKRIDGACRAFQLLRTTRVVWPNSASEVLLAGSFDGWTTQRKMEKSSTGIFSVRLKLYPGRYEIKFIVDGIWRIDPLRPIVHNDRYENNLLIIS